MFNLTTVILEVVLSKTLGELKKKVPGMEELEESRIVRAAVN